MEKGSIICVDDESVVLTSLKSQLSRHFENAFNIEIAESAEDAIEIIEDLLEDNEDIPLVISDQIMPGMKGDEFLIKLHNDNPKTLKILLTGQADANAVGNTVNNANLYRYIAKPWDETDLVLTVKEAIRRYFQDKKLEIQNEELKELNQSLEKKVEERTIELIKKNQLLEEQRKYITDSIKYAKRIQNAVLPSREQINEILPEHFIFFKPRDIVSGDFYWIKQIKNFNIVAVADCTGHGVPGAFMSMLGCSFLNEIVTGRSLNSPGSILNKLRTKVKKSLRQKGRDNEQKDGMDIAFYIIDIETLELQFSGAYNSLYVVRRGELIQLKANRQPIAIHMQETDFETHIFQLQKGDCLYAYSDGFPDQFGGKHGRKYKSGNFIKLLLSIADKPMSEQYQILNDEFEKWRGNYIQVDDILVLGIRINTIL